MDLSITRANAPLVQSGNIYFKKPQLIILFLADPNSVHDIKWMSYFSEVFKCYLVSRKEHLCQWDLSEFQEFRSKYNIEIIGSLQDFSIKYLLRSLLESQKLNRMLIKYNIDVFHVMYADPNSLWAVFRNKKNKAKWILTTRGSDVLKGIPTHFTRTNILNRVISKLYTIAFKNFDRITCTSETQRSAVRKMVGVENLEIIRTGVDIASVLKNRIGQENPLLKGRPYVLFPRMMAAIYNHEFSLEAISLLPDHLKNNYVFVFVDKDSKDQSYVKKITQLMQSDPLTQFLFLNRQSQEQIWELYKNADLVVMNPLSDGSPVSAMEAMVCKAPLVLGNLFYDKDLFEGVVIRLDSWDAKELTAVMSGVLSGSITVDVEAAYTRIISMGNREIEMEKLQLVYLS